MKSSLKTVRKAMASFDEDGPYDPGARRAALTALKKHGWTEAEYLTACEEEDDSRESSS